MKKAIISYKIVLKILRIMRGGFTRTGCSVPIYLLGWLNDSFLRFIMENVSEVKMIAVLT